MGTTPAPTTNADVESGATTTVGQSGAIRSWQSVGSKLQCDTGAGEVYLQSSPGKVSGIELCKMSCEDSEECQSITYYKSTWCSHYSTPCTNTKKSNKGVGVMRLIVESGVST